MYWMMMIFILFLHLFHTFLLNCQYLNQLHIQQYEIIGDVYKLSVQKKDKVINS